MLKIKQKFANLLPAGDLKDFMLNNLKTYMRQSFAIFTNPNYQPDKKIYDGATKWIANNVVSKNKDLAIEYAHWIASADCQKDIFYKSGGQPGNAIAWEDKEINSETNNFFVNTRLTLDLAWVRPRHNGYMKFQDQAGDVINDYLKSNIKEELVCNILCKMYKESFEE